MDKTFKPSVEWMSRKYDELNNRLFNGELGRCDFGIFTSGRGSEGGTLGKFRMTAKGLKMVFSSRQIFLQTWDGRLFVDRYNFYDVCKPIIELNGNYSGAESSFTATLVHEMCHYYDYMRGTVPKQGHGSSFRYIASVVSNRSNGEFTVKRLASAEQMAGYELNDEMKAKRERRKDNLMSKLTAIFIFTKQGQVRLFTTSNQDLIRRVYYLERPRAERIVLSKDPKMIEYLIQNGYKRNFRRYAYWDVTRNEEVLRKLDTCQHEELNENRKNMNIKELVREVVEDFIDKNTNNVVDIDPNMDLGIMTP